MARRKFIEHRSHAHGPTVAVKKANAAIRKNDENELRGDIRVA